MFEHGTLSWRCCSRAGLLSLLSPGVRLECCPVAGFRAGCSPRDPGVEGRDSISQPKWSGLAAARDADLTRWGPRVARLELDLAIIALGV